MGRASARDLCAFLGVACASVFVGGACGLSATDDLSGRPLQPPLRGRSRSRIAITVSVTSAFKFRPPQAAVPTPKTRHSFASFDDLMSPATMCSSMASQFRASGPSKFAASESQPFPKVTMCSANYLWSTIFRLPAIICRAANVGWDRGGSGSRASPKA